MASEKFTLRSAVYVILEKDGQILLMRRQNTGWGDGEYALPNVILALDHIKNDVSFSEWQS